MVKSRNNLGRQFPASAKLKFNALTEADIKALQPAIDAASEVAV